MGSAGRASLATHRGTSERLFVPSKEGSSRRLSNFLSLSEHAKGMASRGLQRQASQKSSISQKKSRRISVLNSLDKFLQCDDDDATASTYHQSSFSSGISNETVPQHATLASGNLSRMEPNIAEEGEEHRTPGNTKASQRYKRRGSITKFTLEKEASQSKLGISQSNDDSFSNLQDHKSFQDSFAADDASVDASVVSIDERPIPMKAPVSIDALPLPMKQTASGRPPRLSSWTSSNKDGKHRVPKKSSAVPQRAKSLEGLGALPLACDDDVSLGHSEHRRSYRRRGSVTKYSLDEDSQSIVSEPFHRQHSSKTLGNFLDGDSEDLSSHHDEEDNMSDHRSCFSEGILEASKKKKLPTKPLRSSKKGPPVTSSGAAAGSLARGLAFISRHQPSRSVSTNSDDSSVASSIGMESTGVASAHGGGRFRRRGSVTKYSLDEDDLASVSHDDDRSIASECIESSKKPQRKTSSSKSKKISLKPSKKSSPKDEAPDDGLSVATEGRARYNRRGSVTRYSVNQNDLAESIGHDEELRKIAASYEEEDNRSCVSESVLATSSKPKKTSSKSRKECSKSRSKKLLTKKSKDKKTKSKKVHKESD